MNKNIKEITEKQNNVLDFIKKFAAEHGYPPSIREIGQALGLSSPATVHTHVRKLCNAGYLKVNPNKFRAMEILVENEYEEKKEELVKVPLLGKVTAGSPIEAIERPNEFFSLPASLIPAKETIFTLNVSGESMINAGIYDGDVVIVQKQSTARNGEIVVAMTEENEVTLKTYYKEKGHIRLQPENDSMEPFIFDNVIILGKAIGLYRKF
jgi:repressor LexA